MDIQCVFVCVCVCVYVCLSVCVWCCFQIKGACRVWGGWVVVVYYSGT